MDQNFSQQLDLHFDNSPSILRNSALILIIRIAGWILAITFLFLGAAMLLTENTEQILNLFVATTDFEQAQISKHNQLTTSLGVLFLGISALLFILVRLCKMIAKRNLFVLELFTWHEDLKKCEKEKIIK